jgi:hypothetical protein
VRKGERVRERESGKVEEVRMAGEVIFFLFFYPHKSIVEKPFNEAGDSSFNLTLKVGEKSLEQFTKMSCDNLKNFLND